LQKRQLQKQNTLGLCEPALGVFIVKKTVAAGEAVLAVAEGELHEDGFSALSGA